MNEVVFLLQLVAVFAFIAWSIRLGQAALIGLIAISGVLANLFVIKQITLFGLEVTCSDIFSVSGILGLNLLQERYGKESTRQAMNASFLTCSLFMVFSIIHLLYVPSLFDQTQEAFQTILSSTPRIMVASVGVYYLVQRLDLLFFRSLQQKISSFAPRVLLSLFFSQALDTVLFSFLGLYGIVTPLCEMMLFSFFVKCIVIVCSAPAALFLQRFSRELK